MHEQISFFFWKNHQKDISIFEINWSLEAEALKYL